MGEVERKTIRKGASVFHVGVQCYVTAVMTYNFRERCGRLDMEHDSCCNMNAASLCSRRSTRRS